MLPITATPEFHAVFAADLDAVQGRAAEALDTLCASPGDESAQHVLHNALHGLKGLAGIAGSQDIEETVALLSQLTSAAAELARRGVTDRALAIFEFCRASGYDLRALCADTTEGRAEEAHAAARRLHEAARRDWNDLLYDQQPAQDDVTARHASESEPIERGESDPPPATAQDHNVGADADVLAFLQDLGVEATTPAPAQEAVPRDERRFTEFPPTPPPAVSAPATEPRATNPVMAYPRKDAPAVDAEMLQYFIPETEEYCEGIEAALATWEKTPDATEPRLTLLRLFHTIKGAANSIGLSALGELAHTLEDVFETERSGADSTAEKPPVLPVAVQRRIGARSIEAIRAFLRAAVEGRSGTMPPRATELLDEIGRARAEAAQPPATEPTKAEPGPLDQNQRAAASAASESVSGPAPAREPAAEEATFESPGARIDSATLDRLMDLVGELSVSRNRLLAKVESFTAMSRELESCKGRLLKLVSDFQDRHEYSVNRTFRGGPSSGKEGVRLSGFGELEFDQYDELNILARQLVEIGTDTGELIDQSRRFFATFTDDTDKFRKTSGQLQEAITHVRMVPLATLLRRLRRVALEAADKEGKEIELETLGGDTRLDKVIAEGVFSPLLHLVRNAVSHGIESPERREAAGKPRVGRLVLRASQRSNQAIIELEDDGGGLDFDAIRQRALRTGLLSAEAADSWDEARLTNLIFQPGFSTRETAGDVAGRGIGLDAVLQQVARLGGLIEITSRAGRGCTFTLKLPLTLAIGQAMFIACGGQRFALPLNFVDRLVSWRPGDLSRDDEGQEFLRVPDATEPLPFLRLEALLGLPRQARRLSAKNAAHGGAAADGANQALAVVAKLADKRIVLSIDSLLRRAETVTKPLGPLLADHPFFSSATIDTDGSVVLILDVPRLAQGFFARHGLYALVQTASAAAAATPAEPTPASAPEAEVVLIVDDSLSVRKVAEKYATELGYAVETASDGVVALEKLGARKFSLVLTDLEMPRMHGFELLEEIRRREATRELPVIVVTSRQAEKHSRQAAALGANDYLIKPFSKAQLGERMAACLGARTA